MLESDFVTRCPKCETTFRVTETQLAAAHGAVRCGACLQVFAANDHLIHAESIVAEPFIAEAPVLDTGVLDTGDVDIGVLDTGVVEPAVTEPAITEAFDSEVFDSEAFVSEALIELDDPAGDSSEIANDNPDPASYDLSEGQVLENEVENAGKAIFGVDYFVTEGMPEATPKVDREVEPIEDLDAPFVDALNPEEDMAAARSDEFKFAGEAGQSEVINVSGADEAALNALFDELNNDGAIPSESREDLLPSDLSDGSTENKVDLDSVEAEPLFRMELEPDSGAKEFKSVVEQEAALPDGDVLESDVLESNVLESDVEAPGDAIDISSERTIPTAAEVVLSNLDDDQHESIELVSNINLEAEVPEEIVGDFEVPAKSHNLSWFLGTVLLTAVLVSQYAYVNIEFLVQQPKLRPYYALFCNYASCRLPAFEDIASIETTELVVRVHSEIERALLVDAIIRNTSIYRQAFPPLEMRFTGINNLVIASRLFLPMEYLGGEMLGLKFIPPRTEVRLGLEIVDPGENAFGYSLEAVQPK